jgi:5-methylcytosine-specific restriction endonuclease McrA
MSRDKRKYADRAEYLKKAVSKRRKKIREMAIDYKGRKCAVCGYNKCIQALEFNHIYSDGKDFGISAKGYTRSWEEVRKELDKCILLCANCHREMHEGITQLP